MELIGYKKKWEKDEGLQPIRLGDIQINATECELRDLSDFFGRCVVKLRQGMDLSKAIELEDSTDNSETGITITVVSSVQV